MTTLWVAAGILVTAPNEWDKYAVEVRPKADTHYVDIAETLRVGDPAEEYGNRVPAHFHPADGGAPAARRSTVSTADSSSFTAREAFQSQSPSTGATAQAVPLTSVIDREDCPASIALPSCRAEPFAHPRAIVVPSVAEGVGASKATEPVTYDDIRPRLLAIRHLCREVLGTDHIILQTALAAFAANMHLDGVPIWVLLVGPPSSGRSMVISQLRGRPGAVDLGIVTHAGLLSGTPRRDRSETATGGALHELGDRGVLLVSELSSYLTDGRGKNSLMAAFRDIYDGSWTRYLGTDGV